MQNKSIFFIGAKYTLLFLAFAPLMVNKTNFFGYIEAKALYIRAVMLLAALLATIFFFTLKKEKKMAFIAGKKQLFKTPLFILLSSFLALALVSAIFALDKYRAFFGNFERAEGITGLFFFFVFLFLALLLFKKEEWNIFFALVAGAGITSILQAIAEFLKGNGLVRPSATFGNPAYLAGYLLFVIFATLILLAEGLKSPALKTKKIFLIAGAIVLILASSTVIFITQVRGAMVGLAAGALFVALYVTLTIPKKIWFKKSLIFAAIGLALLAVIVAGLLVFISKQSIQESSTYAPRFIFNRLLSTGSFETRLIAAGVSLRAINPANVGWRKFLLGWGPENYYIAYDSYFDPNYFKYENVWFDRAHDKLFDVLVMNGVLGLAFYLGLWVSVFFLVFRWKSENNWAEKIYPAAAIFFAVSYFTQNLFLFDTIATYIAFFGFLAFVDFNFSQPPKFNSQEYGKTSGFGSLLFSAWLIVFTIFALAFFVWATLLPYIQTKKYIYLKSNGLTITQIVNRLDEVLTPYYNGQDLIRMDLVKSANQFSKNDPGTKQLNEKILSAANGIIAREPYEPRFAMNTGMFLENIGDVRAAEAYYRKAISRAPNRPDLIYLLGQNLVAQGRIDDALQAMNPLVEQAKTIPQSGIFYGIALAQAGQAYHMKSFEIIDSSLGAVSGQLPIEEISVLRKIYEQFMLNLYIDKDKDGFIRALTGAIKIERMWEKNQEDQYKQGLINNLEPKKSETYQAILDGFQKNGWNTLKIEVKQ